MSNWIQRLLTRLGAPAGASMSADIATVDGKVDTDQYYDRIFFDEDAGIAGTDWPVGTPQAPSDVIADVITMCAARNLHKIEVHGALTLGDTMQHYSFIGAEHEDVADQVDLNGQDLDGSHIEGLLVTGAQGGANFLALFQCIVNAVTDFHGLMERCNFWAATCSFKDTGRVDLVNCSSIYGTVTITVQAPTRASIKDWNGNLILTAQDGGTCFVRGFKGTLEIDEMTGGTLSVYANGADIIINADCTAGTINIYGNAKVTGAGGGVTINNYTLDIDTDPLVMGKSQIAATTIDLDLGIGSHDLFTGTAQAVILESLNIKLPTGAPGGTLTSISIQTDDATPGVIISAADGAVANLLTEADLGWTGTLYITVGTKIQLSILGGPSVADYICNVTAKCRAVVAGGNLA